MQLGITAKAVAEHKTILFSTVRKGFLLCFTLSVMCLKHRDGRLGDQAAHKGACPANVTIVPTNDISLGLAPVRWVGLVQFGRAKARDGLSLCVTAWQC